MLLLVLALREKYCQISRLDLGSNYENACAVAIVCGCIVMKYDCSELKTFGGTHYGTIGRNRPVFCVFLAVGVPVFRKQVGVRMYSTETAKIQQINIFL